MQIETADTRLLIDLLGNSHKIAIIPSKVSGADAFCAGVGLYHMLKEKEGKSVFFIYQGKIPNECVNLIKKEEITYNIFQRELMVSIDYSETPAASAHYSTENDVLYIKIGPVSKNFNLSKVKTELSGFDFDTIITLGVQELDDLGQTYKELSDEFSRAKIINLDNTVHNTNFGAINLIDPTVNDLSSLVFSKAFAWGLTPNSKAAKALLTGITYREIISH